MTYNYGIKHGPCGKLHTVEECEESKEKNDGKCEHDKYRSEGGSVFCCSG